MHPNNQSATKKEIDDAWLRVGKSNNLSVHESRSIFKVLQKKYEQEKQKDSSAWKLFAIMDQIHKVEVKPETKDEDAGGPMEEDEEYEMLEVQEEEEGPAANGGQSAESGSEGDSPNKSNSHSGSSAEKEEKKTIRASGESAASGKILNTVTGTPRTSLNSSASQAAALQMKGITMKKTTPSAIKERAIKAQIAKGRTPANAGAMHGLEMGKTIQLSESLKRKLSQDNPSTPQTKKPNQQNTPQSASRPSPNAVQKSASPQHRQQQHTTTAQLLQLKQDCQDQQISNVNSSSGINVITIPGNPSNNLVNGIITTTGAGPSSSTGATVASTTSTNGFSPRIEEIDFRNDIIFEANGPSGAQLAGKVGTSSEIINLGNFENALPPTFFKNLCNSTRHEALGLYVANVMNRLRQRSAAKLEVGILRAILDIQSEELDQ